MVYGSGIWVTDPNVASEDGTVHFLQSVIPRHMFVASDSWIFDRTFVACDSWGRQFVSIVRSRYWLNLDVLDNSPCMGDKYDMLPIL